MGISQFWEGLGLEYPVIQVLGTGLDLSHDRLWHLDRVEAVLLYAVGQDTWCGPTVTHRHGGSKGAVGLRR